LEGWVGERSKKIFFEKDRTGRDEYGNERREDERRRGQKR